MEETGVDARYGMCALQKSGLASAKQLPTLNKFWVCEVMVMPYTDSMLKGGLIRLCVRCGLDEPTC
jgi:hypothetical protein